MALYRLLHQLRHFAVGLPFALPEPPALRVPVAWLFRAGPPLPLAQL